MKVLIVVGPTYGLVFPLVPLAWSLRAAGHEVLVTGTQNTAAPVLAAGLAFTAASGPLDLAAECMAVDRAGTPIQFPVGAGEEAVYGYMGGGFARLAAYTVEGMAELAGNWRPDVVVGSTFHFAAQLLARRLGVPWVSHAVEMVRLPLMEQAAERELAPELGALNLTGLTRPELFLDICPPRLREPSPLPGQSVRYVPYNTPAQVEPWMVERSNRPRVCVTLGSRVAPGRPGGLETLARFTTALAKLDVDLLVASTPETAALLAPLPAGVRAGWLPLDAVIPACDLVVNHGGGNTTANCLAAGVPQLMLPYMVNTRLSSRRLHGHGGAVLVEPGQDGPEQVAAACEQLLADGDATKAAQAMREEILRMPGPAEAAVAIAHLVGH